MKNIPKIMLLSCTPPGPQGVGGIILYDLCRAYPHGSICSYIIQPAGADIAMLDELGWMPVRTGIAKDDKTLSSRVGKMGKLLSWTKKILLERRHLCHLIDDAVEFGRFHRVDMLWSVLDAPTSIAMALPLSKKLKVPLISLVWDDVKHLAGYFSLDRLTSGLLIRRCGDALRLSKRCAVIGESMKAHYEKRYGANCVILRHGVPEEMIRDLARSPNECDFFSIGFAGSVYARSEFDVLLKALSLIGWNIAGKQIKLRLMGPRFDLRAHEPASIEYLGWQSLEDTIKLLSETDITYLPQPFDESLQTLSHLSFPTKLTTYLAAGRPILIHCPAGASLEEFYKRYPVGTICNSKEASELSNKLSMILTDKKQYASTANEGRRAIREEFSSNVFYERFAEFIGIERDLLLK